MWFAKYGGWVLSAIIVAVMLALQLVYEYRKRQLHAMQQRHDRDDGPYRTPSFDVLHDEAPVPPMPNPLLAMWCALKGHRLGPVIGKRITGDGGYIEESTRYCMRCGHRNRNIVVVGKCPVCGAGPNEPCDPGLHG